MPVLVDTSVWVDHLRGGDPVLSGLLGRGEVLAHEAVLGEIALGGVSAGALRDLVRLPAAAVASTQEVMDLIARERLAGAGVGWVDVHLLASTLLVGDAVLWSRDRGLAALAARLGVGVDPAAPAGGTAPPAPSP